MKAIFQNMENYLSYSENKAWKKIQPPKGFESMLVRNKLVKWWTHNDSETATFADDTNCTKKLDPAMTNLLYRRTWVM